MDTDAKLQVAEATIELLRTQNKQLRKTLREVQQAVSTLTAWVPHSEV